MFQPTTGPLPLAYLSCQVEDFLPKIVLIQLKNLTSLTHGGEEPTAYSSIEKFVLQLMASEIVVLTEREGMPHLDD